jgi:hypothetical protein
MKRTRPLLLAVVSAVALLGFVATADKTQITFDSSAAVWN